MPLIVQIRQSQDATLLLLSQPITMQAYRAWRIDGKPLIFSWKGVDK